MAQQKGSKRNEHLRERAKELLTGEEYDQLKRVLTTFSKTGSVYQLCLDLVKIVNSPEKIDLLAEVRNRIPKSLRNKFTLHCKELFVTNTRYDHELGKEYRRDENENRTGNYIKSSSSLKRKKGNDGKRPALQEKNVSSRDRMTSVLDHEEENIEGLKSSETPPSDGDRIPVLIENGHRTFLLERGSPGMGFGFRIRGGTLKHPQITIAAVAKGSSADAQGLKVGDQLIRVNDVYCVEGDVDRAEIVRTIKASSKLYMHVATSESTSENNTRGSRPREEDERTVEVNVQPGQDGWLGCCIRGGTDYACDIHVISVDSESPAEKAGLQRGDVIVKINGKSTANLTHIQAVRLVITSGPNITFFIKPAGRQNRSHRQPLGEQPSTPLRTGGKEPCYGVRHDFPLGNSFSAKFHLPAYQHSPALTSSPLSYHGLEFSLESQQDEVKSNLSPPPPYTVDLPLEHKLLEKGIEKQGIKDSSHSKTICTSKEGEYEDSRGREGAVKMLYKKCPGYIDGEIGSKGVQRSPGSSSEDKITIEGEHEKVAVKGGHEVHDGPNRDVAVKGNQEIIHDGVGDGTINWGQEIQDGSGREIIIDVTGVGPLTSTGNGCCKGTAVNDSAVAVASWDSIPTGTEDHVGRLQLCASKNKCQTTMNELSNNSQRRKDDHLFIGNDNGLPSPKIIPSKDNRGLLLSHIRQFNKTTLKAFSEGSPRETGRYAVKGKEKANVCCDISQQGQATKEKKSTCDNIVSVQEHDEAEEIFMALAKALEMRARVLNTTLSDDDSQESDEEDWDL